MSCRDATRKQELIAHRADGWLLRVRAISEGSHERGSRATTITSLLALAVCVIPSAYAAHPDARTSSPKELSSESLRRLIIESTRVREAQLRNVRVSATTRIYIAREEYGGSTRAVIRDLGVYACSILQDGGSYRIDTDWYRPSSTEVLSSVSGFDAGTGESRCTAQSSKHKRAFGRIDVQHDLNIINNQVVYLLNPMIDQRLNLWSSYGTLCGTPMKWKPLVSGQMG